MVEGAAENESREDVGTRTRRDRHGFRMPRQVTGDVHPSVANAHDHDILADEWFRRPVLLGVDDRPAERSVRLGDVRCPMMSVRDHDGPVRPHGALPGTQISDLDVPLVLCHRVDGDNFVVQRDRVSQREPLCIRLEVLEDLGVMRIHRKVLRHGEVGELEAALRGIDVERGVGR